MGGMDPADQLEPGIISDIPRPQEVKHWKGLLTPTCPQTGTANDGAAWRGQGEVLSQQLGWGFPAGPPALTSHPVTLVLTSPRHFLTSLFLSHPLAETC